MAQFVRLILAGCLAVPFAALATGGGVDVNGCHQSKKAGYHCHSERAKSSGGESASQLDKRLKRECKGRANGGACLGYGSF